MIKKLYSVIICLLFLLHVSANNNILYQYKITFNQNSISKIEQANELVKIFAHTNDIEIIEQQTAIIIKTIYPINQAVFIGKMSKNNINIQNITQIGQSVISSEAIDKIEKVEKQKAIEWNKSGK